MTKQKLVVKVLRMSGSGLDSLKGTNSCVRLRCGNTSHSTKLSGTHEYQETFEFDAASAGEMHFDVMKGKKNCIGSICISLETVLKSSEVEVTPSDGKGTFSISYDAKKEEKSSKARTSEENIVHEEVPTKKEAYRVVRKENAQVNEEHTNRICGDQNKAEPVEQEDTLSKGRELMIVPQPTSRPWFTRISYYYDVSKRVYAYTTSFPIINRVARLGETTTDIALKRISGKTLRELDQRSLVPILSSLDAKLDATISTVLSALLDSQQCVIDRKNSMVENISHAAERSCAATSNAAECAVNTAWRAKEYTVDQIYYISSTLFGGAYSATISVASHVPYLGAKLRT